MIRLLIAGMLLFSIGAINNTENKVDSESIAKHTITPFSTVQVAKHTITP